MVDARLINEAERLLEKYKQIDSFESETFQAWLKKFIREKNVNCSNKFHYTLLMAIVRTNEINFAKLLLENGALVNFQEDDGRTSLMFAVMYKNIKMVKLLLKYGAEIELKDKDSYTALDYAKNRNYKEIFSLFLINYVGEENNLDEEDLKEEVKRVIKL